MAQGLTLREMKFLENHLVREKELAECWKEYNPKSSQNRDLARRSGWRVMQRIREKIGGSWSEAYDLVGIGPSAIAGILNDAMKAERWVQQGDRYDKEKDHATRLKAAHELIAIHGLTEQTINVKVDKPLPLIVVRSGDDIPTD